MFVKVSAEKIQSDAMRRLEEIAKVHNSLKEETQRIIAELEKIKAATA